MKRRFYLALLGKIINFNNLYKLHIGDSYKKGKPLNTLAKHSIETMSLCGKLVSELPINASAEKCYKIFKDNCKHMPNITPKFIQQVDVHDGDWDTHGHGSIKIWNYFAGTYAYKLSTTIDHFLFPYLYFWFYSIFIFRFFKS